VPDGTDPRPHPPDHAALWRSAVAQLAPMAEVWQRILDSHVRGPAGFCAHPCCARPGYGTPYLAHPCPTRVVALHARRLHRGEAP
jgi:hypothetical protein